MSTSASTPQDKSVTEEEFRELVALLRDVRERTVGIETTVDHIKTDGSTTAVLALHKAQKAEQEIEELKGSLTWAHRTIAGVTLASLANIIFTPFS